MNPVEQKIAMQLGLLQLQLAQASAQIDALTEDNAKLKAELESMRAPKIMNGDAHATGH